ncbi:MAG: hypothetical protein WBP17_13155, partial [Gemmatimonadota bacterium]
PDPGPWSRSRPAPAGYTFEAGRGSTEKALAAVLGSDTYAEAEEMARHNREARGIDQLGTLWRISYQPDWLSRIKISRQLPGDRRRSMVTLFRNPARRAEAPPGRMVRTGVSAVDGSADFRVSVEDPDGVVESVVVVTRRKRGRRNEVVKYVLEARLPPPRG